MTLAAVPFAPTMRVLSLGGGTQSCALALMSARGDLPRLDHVVFADTQGELPETYEYLDFLKGELDAAKIPLRIVTAGSLEANLLTEEPQNKNPTPPAHVVNPDGSSGRVGNYRCSYDFKRRIIEREVKRLCGGRGEWKRATVEQWIGFSSDEIGRCKQAEGCRCGHQRVKRAGRSKVVERVHGEDGCTRCKCTKFDAWETNVWPLIELRMKRGDTIRWFAANGYPTPPRSACWFCPNSRNDRWQSLKLTHPDLFERACVLDETIRSGGGFRGRAGVKFDGTMYLHETRVALRHADLRTERERIRDGGQGELFDPDVLGGDCEAGVCFT